MKTLRALRDRLTAVGKEVLIERADLRRSNNVSRKHTMFCAWFTLESASFGRKASRTVSIVVHSTAVESPIRFCPLAAAEHAARSIPSGRRNASLITIIKEFLRSPKATAYPSLVKSKER
ncbi:hypothetical protein ALC56_01097 [Trachymyrmex septentrionalis]|uniref:Uncharacterized protein n=1 Tax=Trachymyrmex septentrionalis TaxID=34720 RepID=A0A195FX24_9HYME|nr:hypothetical protein ALC56_01097 [Trachymyrmex septentrionalis]